MSTQVCLESGLVFRGMQGEQRSKRVRQPTRSMFVLARKHGAVPYVQNLAGIETRHEGDQLLVGHIPRRRCPFKLGRDLVARSGSAIRLTADVIDFSEQGRRVTGGNS